MATSVPLFSIVIPAYNYAQTLPRALESALLQKGSDYEVLVVNDGSSDNTEEVLAALHHKYPGQFYSVSRHNSGLAATRNYGIQHTRGTWLIFLDSDDEFEAGALANLRATITAHPDARMVVGGHISVTDDGKSKHRCVNACKNSRATQEELFKGYLLDKTVTPSNGATAMHRHIFNNILYREEVRNSEDITIFAYAFAS